jgi:hypothetical protein
MLAPVRQRGIGYLVPLFRRKVDDTIITGRRNRTAERQAHGMT